MDNNLIIALYSVFLIMISITIIISYIQKGLGECNFPFQILCFSLFFWLLGEIFFLACTNEKWFSFLFNVTIPFVSLSAVMNFIVTIKFYRVKNVLSPQIIVILFIIPIITTIIALTGDHLNLLRKEFYVTAIEPLKTYVNVRGSWFWIHSVHSYVMLLGAVLVIISNHRKLPRGYRMSSVLYILGIATTTACNIFSLVYHLPFDITVIGMCLAFTFIYVAIAGNGNMDLLMIARNDIFNYLEEIVFILDNNRTVADYNYSAKNFLEKINFEIKSHEAFTLENIVEHTKQYENVNEYQNFRKTIGSEIYVYVDETSHYYDVRERIIKNDFHEELGYYVSLFDMTSYQNVITNLEISARIDILTGLYNRITYEEKKKELDKEENYPLGIILGDVNGLKLANDDFGHKTGDRLLQLIGKGLKETLPNKAHIFRIGGDEFVSLIPNTTEIELKNIINNLNRNLDNKKDDAIRPSMSSGYSIKINISQNIEELINEADEKMYFQKALQKEKRESLKV